MNTILLMLGAVMLGAAELVLPIGKVESKAVLKERVYPARVVAIQRVDVVPQVSGEILEVEFENGADVKEGQVLYRLDPVKYEAAVKNAASKLAECKANVKYAELSYERHKKLLNTRAVSLDAVDNALSQRDSSRSAHAAAQANLVSAKDDLAHCVIVAPISGKIGTSAKTKGNYVNAGSESLVTLVQTSPVRVAFSMANRDFLDLFDASLKNLKNESIVTLTLANGADYDEEGVVEYFENVADERTDTIRVFVVFQNASQRLNVGSSVRISLSTRNGVAMPAVPPTAVLQDIQGPYVWIVGDDGIVERRAIARGDLKGDWLIVEKGLKIGEKLVVEGAHRVRKGMKIKPFVK
jgi:membrane fusion protein (multidrug efflux system)